jgi:hypothetical protein
MFCLHGVLHFFSHRHNAVKLYFCAASLRESADCLKQIVLFKYLTFRLERDRSIVRVGGSIPIVI